jgi:hypothetical protein
LDSDDPFSRGTGGVFVYGWPTLYRYDHISLDGDIYPVRIHSAER